MIKDWKPKPRTPRIPIGYMKQEGGDPNLLYPNPEVIPYLDKALDQLDAGISLREAAEWFSVNSPEKITHVGLKHVWFNERPNSAKEHQLNPVVKTRAEKALQRKKFKISRDKLRIAAAKKRVLKAEQELTEQRIEQELQREEDLKPFVEVPVQELKESFTEDIPEEDLIFKPHPGPQTTFLAASEQEVLYGGAAGAGKSYAIIADPMRYFGNPNFNGLILRRTNDELRELIWKTQMLYPKAYPGSKWAEKKSSWTFPAGGHLWMTYLERDEDVMRYHGQSFSYIAFDELTQHPTPFAWNFMRSRLRTTDPTLTTCMRATTNPGGPGHGWVKRMFIDPAPYGQAFPATDIDTGKPMFYPKGHVREGQPLFYRRFIPGRLSDNPSLTADGQYETNLLSLPEHQRRQLLEGDWSVAEGAAFAEFRLSKHTCKPFEIPNDWMKFRSCDFGYSERQASAVHWYAVEPSTGCLYVYRELYVNQMTGTQLAYKILSMEEGEDISYGVLDSSVWAVRGQTGPTIAEEMIRAGCRWRPSDRSQGSRIASKNRLHELLRVDSFSQKPGIIFFDTCRQIISDLPVIPQDKDSDDIDKRYANDHAYDSIRYGIQTRPRAMSPWEMTPTSNGGNYRPVDKVFGY